MCVCVCVCVCVCDCLLKEIISDKENIEKMIQDLHLRLFDQERLKIKNRYVCFSYFRETILFLSQISRVYVACANLCYIIVELVVTP